VDLLETQLAAVEVERPVEIRHAHHGVKILHFKILPTCARSLGPPTAKNRIARVVDPKRVFL
jgi:hypothetical protein